MKQYYFGELHQSTTEKYMARVYPLLDFGIELLEDKIIARVIKEEKI